MWNPVFDNEIFTVMIFGYKKEKSHKALIKLEHFIVLDFFFYFFFIEVRPRGGDGRE